MNQRAQAETTVREALRELDMWGAAATFQLTSYEGSPGSKSVPLIRDWREVVSQVGDHQALLTSLKDSSYYKRFEDKVLLWEQRLGDLDECFKCASVAYCYSVATCVILLLLSRWTPVFEALLRCDCAQEPERGAAQVGLPRAHLLARHGPTTRAAAAIPPH